MDDKTIHFDFKLSDMTVEPFSSITSQMAQQAQADLQRRLDIAALKALEDGYDFVIKPGQVKDLAPISSTSTQIDKNYWRVEYTVEAGPVAPGLFWPREWRVVSLERWQALSEEERKLIREKVRNLGG